MTTLDSIGYTVAAGFGVSLLSFAAFGLALRLRSINIAPRCTARHPDTIYNAKAKRTQARKVKDNDDVCSVPRDELQYRGNCIWGWIPWAVSLPYETLLKGVPGTGTRKGGVEGSLLKVNLDGIIMIKFHAMCLKVALLATALCIGICLPINYTACFRDENSTKECSARQNFTSMTNFEKTTLAAIPQIIPRSDEIFASTIAPSNLLVRFYTIVLVGWLIYIYTIRLLQREWVENLALRRVYYLEADHWDLRSEDLRETELSDSDSDESSDGKQKDSQQTGPNRKQKSNYRNNRDPWIPHPEMRETVPNIELYSVLVGNLPSSLSEILYDPKDTLAQNLTKKEIVEWQLNVTSAFFDRCVPRPPGFSSSVAAVTILPDAPDLAAAWRKWYQHAVMVRKLRLVRSLLARMRHFEIPDVDDDDDDLKFQVGSNTQSRIDNLTASKKRIINDAAAQRRELSNFEAHLNYFRNVFGSRFDGGRLDGDVLHLLDEASMFGPEQIAAYSRESAHSAAGCCTYGCCEERIRAMNIDSLAALEREVALRAERSYENLKHLQSTYVKKTVAVDANSDAPDCLHSNHTSSEGLNLKPEIHRLSRLSKRKQKIYPPQIDVPRKWSDIEKSLLREESSPESSNVSVMPALGGDRVGFHKPLEIKIDDNYILGSSYLGDTKWAYQQQRSPRISIDLGNVDNNISPRLRLNTDWSHMSIQSSTGAKKESQWNQVERLVENDSNAMGAAPRKVDTGVWEQPLFDLKSSSANIGSKISQWAKSRTKVAVRNVIGESNFAVVTFTSRQAAIAARNCLADGRGYNRFRIINDHPIPPLADAAVCDIIDCRGCCRPVTITHSSKLQFVRKFIARTIMIGMYIFWTVPIQFAVSLVDLKELYAIWPFLQNVAKDNEFLNRLISGFVPALLFSSFFATAPHIFRALANFGSNAISINQAEFFAMKYYWWFMLITAFSLGSTISTIVLNAINQRRLLTRLFDNQILTGVLAQVAQTLPTQVSATWLNWIIFRTLMTLPMQYMLQINTFLFQCLGWKCCRRCLNGGGPGGPIPYRIYIDSGVVFLCTVALGPICPLLAPASALYFLFCIPLWRRNCIFIYRPTFDAGGALWPFLADVCLTSMIFAQVFLTVIMSLKKAIGPAVLAALPIIFVLAYRRMSRKRFLKAYVDAALFQASLLDCWGSSFPLSTEKREEYRKFLVDSHKAAYVPICMAVGETSCLTMQPAEVVPYEDEELTVEGSRFDSK